VLVPDHNFANYSVIAWALEGGRHVVIRCPRQSFAAVNEFWLSGEAERLVTLGVTHRQAAFVRHHQLPETLPVRLLRFGLPTGETEVLLTTLTDATGYPPADFYEVCGWRWNQEVFYDRFKNVAEVERFSGQSERAIRQDFDGLLFLLTLESVLAHSAQQALDERARPRPVPPRVNRVISYVSLLDTVVALLADESVPVEVALRELRQLLQTNPTSPRPGRNPERKARSQARSLRYQRYRKRLPA